MFEKYARALIGEERIARYRFEQRFLADQRENRPVLFVHQMGKVGSTTIVQSLKSQDLAIPWRIYQTHFLSPEGMALVEELESRPYGGWAKLSRKKKRLLTNMRTISEHIAAGDFSGQPSKVISLVRDPVSTNLSGFFHNYRWWPADLTARCRANTPGWEAELLEYFLASYPHNVPADWFDLEMKSVFGVDVFTKDFDKRAGYTVYDSQDFPMLLLRLENLNETMSDVIPDFLDIESFTVRRSNAAEDKWYADQYDRFKSAGVLPSTYLDQMYSAAAVRHFYSPSEIAEFRKKWEEPEAIGFVSRERQ